MLSTTRRAVSSRPPPPTVKPPLIDAIHFPPLLSLVSEILTYLENEFDESQCVLPPLPI